MFFPSRVRNAYGYAIIAGCVAYVFFLLFFYFIGITDSLAPDTNVNPKLFKQATIALVAIPAAFVCWPRRRPSTIWRMSFAGVATVALSFYFIGLVMGLSNPSELNFTVKGLFEVFVSLPAMVLIMGSLLTLGIPYILGVFVSILFAEPAKHVV